MKPKRLIPAIILLAIVLYACLAASPVNWYGNFFGGTFSGSTANIGTFNAGSVTITNIPYLNRNTNLSVASYTVNITSYNLHSINWTNCVITLPAVSNTPSTAVLGFLITAPKGSATITNANGVDQVCGSLAQVITNFGGSLFIYNDGTNWQGALFPTNVAYVDANNNFTGSNWMALLSVVSLTASNANLSPGTTTISAGQFTTSTFVNPPVGNGSGWSNLNGGAITGKIDFVQWDASAYMTNASYNSNTIAYVTPGAGSGNLQGSAPVYLLYPFTTSGTNQFFVQTYMPPSWNSNAVNLSVHVLCATNSSLTATTMVFSASASWNGSALTAPVTITNTIPISTGFIETNIVVGPIPTSGTILPNESVVFQVQYWAVGNGKITNSAWSDGCRMAYTNSTVQNALVTGW